MNKDSVYGWGAGRPFLINSLAQAFERGEGRDLLILVDGLGAEALSTHKGHTPFFRAHAREIVQCPTVFPSTTASAITSLFTGVSPLEHGVIGYESLNGESNSVNNLSGAESIQPDHWRLAPTLGRRAAERGRALVQVGPRKYASSFLSGILHPEPQWQFFEANTNAERQRGINRAFRERSNCVVYCHIPDIDKAGHKFGPGSYEWIAALEETDAHLKRIVANLPSGTRVWIGADHGMVSARVDQIHDLDKAPTELASPVAVAGEGRALMLRYRGFDASALDRLHEWVGDRGKVLGHDELKTSGHLGPALDLQTAAHSHSAALDQRLGDALIIANGEHQFTHSRHISETSLRQKGVHGALTEAEMLVPVLQLEV